MDGGPWSTQQLRSGTETVAPHVISVSRGFLYDIFWYLFVVIGSIFIRLRNTIIIKKPAGLKLNLRRSSSAWPVIRDNRFHFNRGTSSSCLQNKFPFQEVGWIGGNNPDDGLPRFFGLTSKNLLRLAWIVLKLSHSWLVLTSSTFFSAYLHLHLRPATKDILRPHMKPASGSGASISLILILIWDPPWWGVVKIVNTLFYLYGN